MVCQGLPVSWTWVVSVFALYGPFDPGEFPILALDMVVLPCLRMMCNLKCPTWKANDSYGQEGLHTDSLVHQLLSFLDQEARTVSNHLQNGLLQPILLGTALEKSLRSCSCFRLPQYVNVTSLFHDIHRLPVGFWVQFKMLVATDTVPLRRVYFWLLLSGKTWMSWHTSSLLN